jgi:uncharacterized protein (DUF342 family)
METAVTETSENTAVAEVEGKVSSGGGASNSDEASNDIESPDSGGKPEEAPKTEGSTEAGAGDAKREKLLERALVAKVAPYAKGLAAGLGLKALKPDLLAAETSDPQRRETLKQYVVKRINAAIGEAGVSAGVDGDAITEAAEVLLTAVAQGDTKMVTRKVAQGEAPEPGEDGRLEYPMNPDNAPMCNVTGVKPTSKKLWFRMVHKGDTLVQMVAPQAGQAGTSVGGEPVEPGKPKEVSLRGVMGAHTAVEGDRLIAECEGGCEENARGRVRVVPEVVVDEVNAQTGSLPEAGISKAGIMVKGEIKSGYGVSSSENVFVGVGRKGGLVDRDARVTANNLVINGKLMGAGQDGPGGAAAPIDVQGVCAVREVDGCHVTAGRILVVGGCRHACLDADESIRIDGDMVGGRAICRGLLTVAGDLGSGEGGSLTRVVVPQSGGVSRAEKRLAMAMFKQKKQLVEIQEKVEAVDNAAAKRAKSDPYYSQLLSGESRKPKNPVEANTLRQFFDMANEKKRLERMAKDIRDTQKRLVEEAEGKGESAGGDSTVVRVGGAFTLDGAVEVTSQVEEEALETQVTYSVEGQRFRNHTLKDILGILSRQAAEYMEGHRAGVEERKQAIDQMFEGAEKRPTGPQIAHKRFELPFTWSGDKEGADPAALRVSATAFVDTSDVRSLQVCAVAAVPEVVEGLQVTVTQEGPRAKFAAGNCRGTQVKWEADNDVQEALDGVCLRGLSARQFLDGAPLPNEGPEDTEPPKAQDEDSGDGNEEVSQAGDEGAVENPQTAKDSA